MVFGDAFKSLLEGKSIKRPSWKGYWKWEDDNIRMYTKDGNSLLVTETKNVLYTFQNIAADDWEVVENIHVEAVATFSFSDALRFVKNGERISRQGWNGKGMYVVMQVPDAHSKMTRPYLYLECPKGSTKQFGEQYGDFERVPWLASQTDVLANDWFLSI